MLDRSCRCRVAVRYVSSLCFKLNREDTISRNLVHALRIALDNVFYSDMSDDKCEDVRVAKTVGVCGSNHYEGDGGNRHVVHDSCTNIIGARDRTSWKANATSSVKNASDDSTCSADAICFCIADIVSMIKNGGGRVGMVSVGGQ